MRVLITGITGFVGSHLAHFLAAKKGVEIYGLRRMGKGRADRTLPPGAVVHSCDLRHASRVHQWIHKIKPERIFHLAAQSSVRFSWEEPQETFMDNVLGTLNVLEAARKAAGRARVLVCGSAEVYGLSAKRGRNLGEEAPFLPLNPYAVSKAAQDFLAFQYFAASHLTVIRTRAFNHAGPSQDEAFVVSHLAKQIAWIEAGRKKPVLSVGNVEVIRDFLDVRDVVSAYDLALEKGRSGEAYNICSGRGIKIKKILELLLNMSPAKIKVRRDRRLARVAEIPCLVGNPRKFIRQTGWRPEISLEKTLKDVLTDWRARIQK